ncbi:MAG TPA: hypothetical protein VF139_10700 [Candidatus Polarisedimenticolaceae bacterium]
MRRRFMIKLVLALVSFVPDVVSFVVDHVPQDGAEASPVRASDGCGGTPASEVEPAHR